MSSGRMHLVLQHCSFIQLVGIARQDLNFTKSLLQSNDLLSLSLPHNHADTVRLLPEHFTWPSMPLTLKSGLCRVFFTCGLDCMVHNLNFLDFSGSLNATYHSSRKGRQEGALRFSIVEIANSICVLPLIGCGAYLLALNRSSY
jgi:hypothetical protein